MSDTVPRVAPARPGTDRREGRAHLLPTVTLVLALLEAAAAVADPAPLQHVRAVLAGAVLVLAIALARPMWRVLAGVFVVAGVLLVVADPGGASAYDVYRSGMLTVTPVVALLVVVTRLNGVVRAGRYNVALAAYLSRRGRRGLTDRLPVLLAYLLAPVLLAGALAQSFGPFQTGRPDADRRLLGVCVRAISLGLVWSPMAAPTAFALTLLDVPVHAYVAIALPASATGFVLLLLTTRTTGAALTVDPEEHDPAKVRRLLLFLTALPVVVAALAVVQGEVSLHVVLLAMSAVTAAWFLADRGRVPRPVAGGRRAGLAAEGVALYLSLGIFVGGVRLLTADGFGWATSPAVVIAVAFLGAAAGFVLGVHPVAVIAVLSPTVLALDDPYLAVGAFALCAGAQAVNVSTPFSPLSVVGSQMAETTPWRVSTPVHWRFSLQQLALYGLVCAAALGLASTS